MKLALLLITLLSVQCFAQEEHVVRASGEASVSAKPDRAIITIGVSTNSPTAGQSSAQNAKTSAAVFSSLKSVMGPADEMKTVNYSISPDYQYTPNMPAKLNGYRTTNSLQVTVADISMAGKIVDAATASGANDINGIAFVVHDDRQMRLEALAEASIKARANAEAMAKALNLHVKGVLQAESSDEAPPPVIRTKQFVMAQRAETSIQPGNVEVHANVTVTLTVE